MWAASDTSRCHADLAGIGLRVGDELRNRRGRNRWIDLHDERGTDRPRDRCDVAEKDEIKLVVERRVDRGRWRNQQERIAIRPRTHDRFRSNVGARAWPVLDNEWLTKPLGQPLSYQTSQQVGVTRRRERHDDANRARRIGLRPRYARYSRERGSTRCQMQDLSTVGKFHSALPE